MQKVCLEAPAELPCQHVTVDKCMENNDGVACKDKYHFAIVYNAYTNVAYGDCTFLSGCYNWDTCPYIHYTRVPAINPKTFADMIKLPKQLEQAMTYKYGNVEEAVREIASEVKDGREYPAQWINTDIMKFNFRVIGRYDVIMIDRKCFPSRERYSMLTVPSSVEHPHEAAIPTAIRQRHRESSYRSAARLRHYLPVGHRSCPQQGHSVS